MSVSMCMANAAYQLKGTLALNALASSDFDLTSPYSSTAGVRVLTTGAVQEIIVDTWTSQNAGVEWINGFFGSDVASNYEVQLAGSFTTGSGTISGPTLSSYHTISTTRQWTLTRTLVGIATWEGTMTIREIADTSNNVSASVFLNVENGSL